MNVRVVQAPNGTLQTSRCRADKTVPRRFANLGGAGYGSRLHFGRPDDMAWRIGVDSGGTFTDVCLFDDATGAVAVWKVPSTPADPSEAIAWFFRKPHGEHDAWSRK